MKRLSLLVLVLAVSVGLAGGITETFRYSSDALKLGTEHGYTTVDFRGTPHAEPLGVPDLPALPYQVVLPPTAEVTGFEITAIEEEPVTGQYDVIPVQHPIPWMENPPLQPFVEPDPEVYSVDAVFPKQAGRLVHTGNKSGYRLASFLVYPVRYNPVQRKLYLVKRITVKVNYAVHKRHVPRYTEAQIGLHGQQVENLVLNPRDVARFAPPKRTRSYGSLFLPPGEFEHVIITREHWADSLVGLRDWRTRQGWRSKIMLLEDFCSTYPGRDTAEKMREFIKDADTTWGTIFVFIARDDYPAKQYRVVRANNYSMFSDMYFSDLDGNWDANGNSVFGELADSVDGLADVHVGMITLNGFTELSTYLAKLFRYEFTPDTDVVWVTKALLPNGAHAGANKYNDSIANATPTPPWFDLKMYASGGMVSPSPSKYCDSLNSGYSINSIIAHGNPDMYSLGGSVTSSLVLGLTNTNRLNLVTAVCCKTGKWDAGSTNGDCIAENMAFHAENGFIGVYMNYESGWIDVAEFYNYSTMYGVLGFRTIRRVTQAEALSYGKDYWNSLIGTGKWRMEAMERNLFGAPAVPVWTRHPFEVSVTAPGAINVGSNIPVPITVTDGNFAPVESAMVCLLKGDETFGRGWTNASGQITLLMSPLTPGQMQLTITCANNIPYLDSIPVMAAGRFVCYLRHSISDPPPGGNDDGIINPGETFRIPTWVKNYGDSTARSVTGRLITHATGVTITDPVKTFGDILGRDSAYNATGFGMQVANGLPNNYPIPCSLVCKDNLDSTWISYVTFHVGAPMLAFVDKVVKDSLSANPNGKLDPGETADLEVTIRNSGLGHGYNVHAVLRSGDSRLTVPDTHAVYGTVLVDSLKTNTTDHFTVHADASIPKGTPIPCTLHIYADAGYSSSETFELIVGEVWAVDPIPDGPRTPPLYWAYDDKDTCYDQHPEYSWVEIKTQGTRLNFPQNDDVLVVNLPSGFGPLKYYGQRYTQISVSADGWIVPGNYTSTNYTNTSLPNSSAPPGAICVNWDDLYPGYGSVGYVYYYHDAANHRFVVEYDSTPYYDQRSIRDKFEVIFYDTTLAAPTGDNVFVCQYMTDNGYSSNTVGLQDQTRAVAIQALFNNTYHEGCYELIAQRAIKYTTDEPTGITEPSKPALLAARRLLVAPSPFRHFATIHWQLSRDANASLKVFDATGRAVRTLVSGPVRAGSYTTLWNGTDDSSQKLAHGIYFVRLVTPESTARVKTVLAR